jgi:hypothetical protein
VVNRNIYFAVFPIVASPFFNSNLDITRRPHSSAMISYKVLILLLTAIDVATSAPVHKYIRHRMQTSSAEATSTSDGISLPASTSTSLSMEGKRQKVTMVSTSGLSDSDLLRRTRGRPRLNDGASPELEALREARREIKTKRREEARAINEGKMEPKQFVSKGRQKNPDSTNVHTAVARVNRQIYKDKVAKAQAIVDQSKTTMLTEEDRMKDPAVKQAHEIVAKELAKRTKHAEDMRNRRAQAKASNGTANVGSKYTSSSTQGHSELDLNKRPSSPHSNGIHSDHPSHFPYL